MRENDEYGEPVAIIDPAWAKDAQGKPQQTRYEVAGDTLTQVIEPADDARFPIVADPRVTDHPLYVSIDLSDDETTVLAGGLAACTASIKKIKVLPKKARAAAGVICAAGAAFAGVAIAKNKCVSIKIIKVPLTWTPWISKCYK